MSKCLNVQSVIKYLNIIRRRSRIKSAMRIKKGVRYTWKGLICVAFRDRLYPQGCLSLQH